MHAGSTLTEYGSPNSCRALVCIELGFFTQAQSGSLCSPGSRRVLALIGTGALVWGVPEEKP